MRPVHYVLLVLLTLTPALALAQLSADSLVVVVNDITYPAIEPWWALYLLPGQNVGPFPVVPVEPSIACMSDPDSPGADPNGFVPLITNADEVEGSIALIARGECNFTTKVAAAFIAGAVGVILYNHDDENPDELPPTGGSPSDSTQIPTAFVSFNTGQAILDEIATGSAEATLEPIGFCGDPPFVTFLSTDAVFMRFYGNGFVGADGSSCYSAFEFGEDNGLYFGSILIGQASGDGVAVTGSHYYSRSEYDTEEPVSYLFPPFEPPFEDFDEGRETRLYSLLGVEVTERAYVRDEDAFIVLELDLTNVTSGDLDSVYVGLFADWDVGEARQNLGGFDEGTNLLYVYDESGASTNYFGMAALDVDTVSGWTLTTDEEASDASLFAGLTTEGPVLAAPQNVRTVIGAGPFDIGVGETSTARFAMLAGTSETEIIAHAQTAQEAVTVAIEETTPEGTFVLEAAYPNPFLSETTISFALPMAQDVRLTGYDVLGREVAVLVDGVQQAGEQSVVFEASGLPSGVYLYRLEASGAVLTQRLTLVH